MDIVERLRDYIPDGDGYNSEYAHTPYEAADEIARLRELLAYTNETQRLREGQNDLRKADLHSTIHRLRDENEALASNLRGKHATTGATYAHLIAERDSLRDENARLQADQDECDALRSKLTDILTRTANALKGEPGELQVHSWHDLPEWAQKLRKDVARWRDYAAMQKGE